MFTKFKQKLKSRGWFLTAEEREIQAGEQLAALRTERRQKQDEVLERHEKAWADLESKVWLDYEYENARFRFHAHPSNNYQAWIVLIDWDGDKWWGSCWDDLDSGMALVYPFGYEMQYGIYKPDFYLRKLHAYLPPFREFLKDGRSTEEALKKMAEWVYEHRRSRNLLMGLQR